MFDSLDDILHRLRAGEDSLVEFKSLRLKDDRGHLRVIEPSPDQLAGELVAFANTEGGVVFLGVADDGVIHGISDDALNEVERWAANVASNNCDPPIRPLLRKVRLPAADGTERAVLLVEVHRGLFVHRTVGGRWYVRVGSSKRDLTQKELGRLLQQRGREFVFDEQPVFDARPEDLDQARLSGFFGESSGIPWPELLRNTRVTVPDEQAADRPTVAGLLAFGLRPREHLRSAYIEAAVYRGTRLHSDDLVHSDQIDGPVSEQIDGAVAFVERFMLKPARKDERGREDHPQYSVKPVREAIVNAVAHRDYSRSGGKIRLFLFTDRLELYSPGALPNTLTLETMPFRVFTRNQLLVSFLSRLRSRHTGRVYLESRGEGVRTILRDGEAHAGRRPEYALHGEELLLTIWAKRPPWDDAEP